MIKQIDLLLEKFLINTKKIKVTFGVALIFFKNQKLLLKTLFDNNIISAICSQTRIQNQTFLISRSINYRQRRRIW